jgi:muramidase (phage lysozyme)
MNIPLQYISEIYDILCEYDEKPMLSKETFFSFCSKGLIFDYSYHCNHCELICTKPFNCSVTMLGLIKMPEPKFKELNRKLKNFSTKYQKTLAFW